MDTHTLATIGSLWVLCAILAGIIAGEKNRRFWVWLLFGLLTGPIALYRAVRTHEVVPPDQAQICPTCKKSIRKNLHTCPRCGAKLVREPDRVMNASRQAAAALFLLRKAAQKSTAAVKAEQTKRQQRNAPKQG